MMSSKAMFFQKMRGYIRERVNPKDLTQRCNEVWENRGVDADAGVMSAAAVQHSQPRQEGSTTVV
jgi:hypothetical protein